MPPRATTKKTTTTEETPMDEKTTTTEVQADAAELTAPDHGKHTDPAAERAITVEEAAAVLLPLSPYEREAALAAAAAAAAVALPVDRDEAAATATREHIATAHLLDQGWSEVTNFHAINWAAPLAVVRHVADEVVNVVEYDSAEAAGNATVEGWWLGGAILMERPAAVAE